MSKEIIFFCFFLLYHQLNDNILGNLIQGKNKHWNLSCVEVTVANTNQLYRFVYNDWLSLTYGKRKSLWVDLPAMIGDTVQLKGIKYMNN